MSFFIPLGTLVFLCLAGIMCNRVGNTKDEPPPSMFPASIDSIQKMPEFIQLFEPGEGGPAQFVNATGGSPVFKHMNIPDNVTNFLKMIDDAGITSPTRSSIVNDILNDFHQRQEAATNQGKPAAPQESSKPSGVQKAIESKPSERDHRTPTGKTSATQSEKVKTETVEPGRETQFHSGAPLNKEDRIISLPAAALAANFIQKLRQSKSAKEASSQQKSESKVHDAKRVAKFEHEETSPNENDSVSESKESESKQRKPSHEKESKVDERPETKERRIVSFPIAGPVVQRTLHPILGGYQPKSLSQNIGNTSSPNNARIITVPISDPDTIASILNNIRPSMQESKRKIESRTQKEEKSVPVPDRAQVANAQKEAEKWIDAPSDENVSASMSEEPTQTSDEKQANEGGKIIKMIPIPGFDDIGVTIRKLDDSSRKTEDRTEAQDRFPQRESRGSAAPSLPEPTLLAHLLQNLKPRVQESSQEAEYQPQPKDFEREGNPPQGVPLPAKMAEIMNAFDSIVKEMMQKSGRRIRPVVPQREEGAVGLPPPVVESANLALPLLQNLDSRFGEPAREDRPINHEEKLPFSIPDFASLLRRPKLELDEPKRETEEGTPYFGREQLFPEFEPTTTTKKEIFEVMYVKHLTFKLQIHMKVWHMFFIHVYPNPEAANKCTVVLNSVSKFYSRLSIDVNVVERFRVLRRVVKMMSHNDTNLRSFLSRNTLEPAIADMKKLMKNARDAGKMQHEIVTRLWEDAMSHFDDQLANVDKFFNDVLNDNEYAGSVLDFIPDSPTEITTYRRYLSRVASDFGTKFLRVDTEITQIRARRKIFRGPHPAVRSSMNEKIMKLYQKAFGQFLDFSDFAGSP